MSRLRFNHVFISLVTLAGLLAFVLPPKFSAKVRGNVDGLFAPVATPVRRLADGISGRFYREKSVDLSDLDLKEIPPAAQEEIIRLRAAVANLSTQVSELAELNASRQLWGDVAPYSTPFQVMGGDGGEGSRKSLMLRATARDGIGEKMPVLHRESIVGQVWSVGVSGSQVRLVTDAGSFLTGEFGRYRRNADGLVEFVRLETPPLLVEGCGDGRMVVRHLSWAETQHAGVKAGDWVVLKENDSELWPPALNGYVLGEVERIIEKPKLFAEVTIRPWRDPQRLREVMVLTKKPPAGAKPVAKTSQANAQAKSGVVQSNAQSKTAASGAARSVKNDPRYKPAFKPGRG